MKINYTIFFILFISTVITGCEGYKCGNGVVIDKLTNQPLDSVFCEAITGKDSDYTGSDGKFDLCNSISGCVPKYKDIVIRLSKSGYITVEVENPENEIIYLER